MTDRRVDQRPDRLEARGRPADPHVALGRVVIAEADAKNVWRVMEVALARVIHDLVTDPDLAAGAG